MPDAWEQALARWNGFVETWPPPADKAKPEPKKRAKPKKATPKRGRDQPVESLLAPPIPWEPPQPWPKKPRMLVFADNGTRSLYPIDPHDHSPASDTKAICPGTPGLNYSVDYWQPWFAARLQVYHPDVLHSDYLQECLNDTRRIEARSDCAIYLNDTKSNPRLSRQQIAQAILGANEDGTPRFRLRLWHPLWTYCIEDADSDDPAPYETPEWRQAHPYSRLAKLHIRDSKREKERCKQDRERRKVTPWEGKNDWHPDKLFDRKTRRQVDQFHECVGCGRDMYGQTFWLCHACWYKLKDDPDWLRLRTVLTNDEKKRRRWLSLKEAPRSEHKWATVTYLVKVEIADPAPPWIRFYEQFLRRKPYGDNSDGRTMPASSDMLRDYWEIPPSAKWHPKRGNDPKRMIDWRFSNERFNGGRWNWPKTLGDENAQYRHAHGLSTQWEYVRAETVSFDLAMQYNESAAQLEEAEDETALWEQFADDTLESDEGDWARDLGTFPEHTNWDTEATLDHIGMTLPEGLREEDLGKVHSGGIELGPMETGESDGQGTAMATFGAPIFTREAAIVWSAADYLVNPFLVAQHDACRNKRKRASLAKDIRIQREQQALVRAILMGAELAKWTNQLRRDGHPIYAATRGRLPRGKTRHLSANQAAQLLGIPASTAHATRMPETVAKLKAIIPRNLSAPEIWAMMTRHERDLPELCEFSDSGCKNGNV